MDDEITAEEYGAEMGKAIELGDRDEMMFEAGMVAAGRYVSGDIDKDGRWEFYRAFLREVNGRVMEKLFPRSGEDSSQLSS